MCGSSRCPRQGSTRSSCWHVSSCGGSGWIPSRPLWEAWFLPGLPRGQVGLFLRMHHAMADGVAGVAAFGALFDLAADAPAPAGQPWTPAPVPSAGELLADNLRRRTQGLDRALSNLADPIATLRRAQRTWPAWRETFAEQRAPRTSLNRPIGPDRRLAIIGSRLDLAKNIAHPCGATVNDVVLAAIAGGLRELLLSRGEPSVSWCCGRWFRCPCTASRLATPAATRTGGWSCRCRSASPATCAGCT